MRITQRAVTVTSLQGLNRNLDTIGKLQQQLTSGKQISSPFDSPTRTNRAMQTRGDQAAVEQQARNISDAQSWLDQTSSTLETMLSQTRRVRDLTVQGLNTGAASDPSQQAMATEVASIRDGLLALANTSTLGRPLFGGVTASGRAYETLGPTSGSWIGNDSAPVMRRVSDTESIRVDVSGLEAFGVGADDLFAVVGRIAANLVADPSALEADLQALDGVMKGMLSTVADVGSRATRVDTLEQINSDRALTLRSQLAITEDIDLPETIMRLQMVQVGYQAALAATAKSIQPSLADFLR
jgi:flagellin-like hook-associated protein FlgL